jgi:diguanylate cyclase (GGDEF)-like protein
MIYWELNADLVFTSISASVKCDLGSLNGLIGVEFIQLPILNMGVNALGSVRDSIASGLRINDLELHIMTGRNESKWFQLSVEPSRDSIGVIIGFRGIALDVTEEKNRERESELENLSDALTSLPSERLLIERFHLAQLRASQSASFGALVVLDIDNFSGINKVFGSPFADQVLVHIGARIKLRFSSRYNVARLNGDRFALLLEELGGNQSKAANQARLVAETLRCELALGGNAGSGMPSISASIGVALFDAFREEYSELHARADLALQQAKTNGKNNVVLFDEAIELNFASRARLLSELKMSIERAQLQLHYQTIVDLHGECVGYEALIRWHHPELGNVPPAVFIPLAEQSRLISAIGNWVIEAACIQLAIWQRSNDQRASERTISVNVSSIQLSDPDFCRNVDRILRKTNAPPYRMRFELTESMLMEDTDRAVEVMNQIARSGIRFSLDDFGTGYSCLSYLKRLPLSQLKIDRAFVREILRDHNDAAIARAILDLSRSMGLTVVAEGVETFEQLELLKEMGCTLFQGFYFGRPSPLEGETK